MQLHQVRRALKHVFLVSLALLALAWLRKGDPVDLAFVHPHLLQPPIQEPTDRAPFAFTYAGRSCRVRPVRRWRQWGLVVSHNDIESFADLVHDSTSVDTKDLCLIWGPNLRTRDFHDVRFTSGQFTCYFSSEKPVRFDRTAAGNDHLITDSDAVRRTIAGIRVGDQVYIEGLLVDYQMNDWGEFWRETSTRRDDTGCEVVFVESIEVLRRGTPFWYALFTTAKAVTLATPLLWLLVFWAEARAPGSRVGEL